MKIDWGGQGGHQAGYEVLPFSLPEKISYREAQNQGLAISEVKYPRLCQQVKELVKSVIKKIGTISAMN